MVILVVYRQLDKNNRSLEKIRKFAETVRQDLNDFVEERTATVKDFDTILKVHDKTAAEILRRIQAVESNLLTRTPEIEQMQSRLDRYASSMSELEAQTTRVDASLDRLKAESGFVDRVTQRIKGAGEQMSALETAFGQIRQEFADINQKDLETVRKNALEVFERETLLYVQQIREAQRQVDGIQNQAEAAATALEERARTIQDEAEAAFRLTASQAEDLSSDVFVKLEDRIATQVKDLEGQLKDAATRLREDFQTEQAQLLTMTAQLKSDLDLKVSSVRQQAVNEADTLRIELQRTLELEKKSAQALAEDVRQYVAIARKETQDREQTVLDAFDARLKDYEATFAYRYAKMEEAGKDIASLDINLRQAMERVAERIQQDFAAFDQSMAQRRQEEQADLDKKVLDTEAAVVRLDKDLEELKSRAYDNVSEKLQGFEEEFFADLQKRNAGMSVSLDEWQKGLRGQWEDLKASVERERTELEREVSETWKLRIQELQNSSFQQFDRLERQIHETQEATAASVRAFRDDVEATRARLVEERAEVAKALEARFEQDRARAELAAGESITKLEREIESRIRTLVDEMDQFRTEQRSGMSTSESEWNLWQTKFSQRFKDLEADVSEQYRSFKATISERIASLSDEFSSQKEDLITKSAEERNALRSDLSQIRTGIEDLEAQLRARAQSATESFERDYETLSLDFQKKNRDLVSDIENRIREYRASVTDTKEKAESLQKKVFGKIEDQAGLLTATFEEIEKRQKNFLSQTKIFERADSLKQDLQEAIEDLKSDLARIEVQRKDLFEIEASIARVKKLSDETSDKAARFTAEKKRIDLMDSDFQKILALSQSMEVRLEQVTSSHDLLQDIQIRIRKLEDYSKDVEVRYERLDKRREALDSTTDGVDRNFALLDKIEKAVRGLDSELKAMPTEVEDLRKRMKVLGAGKEDAERAVERLSQLDQTLKDVESRISRMEQAREWLAGVETRLTETKAAAEEQVHTLATITKASGTPQRPGARGADSDLRQTVLKLARQGWGKEEISRATKLSLGEVELILELGTR